MAIAKTKLIKRKHSLNTSNKGKQQQKGGKKNAKFNKKGKKPQQQIPKIVKPQPEEDADTEEESDHGEDMLKMVEKDDLEFLKSAISNRSYSLLNKVRYTEPVNKGKKRKINKEDVEDDEALEKGYEESTQEPTESFKSLLPIKTKSGIIKRTIKQEKKVEEDAEEDENEEEGDEEEAEASDGDESEEEGDYKLQESELDLSEPISAAQLLVQREDILQKKKLHIGTLSSGLLENPEEKVTNLRTLLKLLDDETPEVYVTIKKLAMVSLLEVFKDVLPSYQIKLQDVTSVKLKKDTLKLHKYEESLLMYYKKYLQKLEKFSVKLYKKRGDMRKRTQAEITLAEMAVHSMCDLLVTHPYFNYSNNIAQAVIPFLNNPNKNVRHLVAAACKTIFKEDKKDEITLQIMRIINHYMKNHSHNVNPDMLEVLLHLRIKEVNLDQEKEQDLKKKKLESHKQNILSLSKKERKRSKKLKELEKELLETKAEENKQKKLHNLTEITKLLFGIYFRILKSSSNTKVLGMCLEGMAKFAHCINLDYFVDIINVLDNLLKEDWLGYRERLHCIQTVFTILSDQGEALNIDPNRFYVNLYKDLLTTHASRTSVNFIVLLQTVITAIIKRRKRITNKRIVGFLKRLSTLALQLLHDGALSTLGVIKMVMQLTNATDILLDTDYAVGDAKYDAEVDDPEYSGASSTALYEVIPLSRHYHPIVCKYARHIASGVPGTGEGSLPPQYTKCSPEQLFVDFDMSEMVFNPSVPIPKKAQAKARPPRHQFTDERFKKLCYERMKIKANTEGLINFYC